MKMVDKFLRMTLPSSIGLVNDGGANERDGFGVCRILQVQMRYKSRELGADADGHRRLLVQGYGILGGRPGRTIYRRNAVT